MFMTSSGISSLTKGKSSKLGNKSFRGKECKPVILLHRQWVRQVPSLSTISQLNTLWIRWARSDAPSTSSIHQVLVTQEDRRGTGRFSACFKLSFRTSRLWIIFSWSLKHLIHVSVLLMPLFTRNFKSFMQKISPQECLECLPLLTVLYLQDLMPLKQQEFIQLNGLSSTTQQCSTVILMIQLWCLISEWDLTAFRISLIISKKRMLFPSVLIQLTNFLSSARIWRRFKMNRRIDLLHSWLTCLKSAMPSSTQCGIVKNWIKNLTTSVRFKPELKMVARKLRRMLPLNS